MMEKGDVLQTLVFLLHELLKHFLLSLNFAEFLLPLDPDHSQTVSLGQYQLELRVQEDLMVNSLIQMLFDLFALKLMDSA